MTQLQVTDEEACPVVPDIRGAFPLSAYCAQCLIKVGACVSYKQGQSLKRSEVTGSVFYDFLIWFLIRSYSSRVSEALSILLILLILFISVSFKPLETGGHTQSSTCFSVSLNC